MNPVCRMPWKSVKVDVEGLIKPCCSYIGGLGTYESAEDISHYLNSSGLQELKARLLRGEEVPECRVCRNEEEQGIFSVREDSLRRYPEASENLDELEISVTNTCNLVCVMCSPRFSSKWHAVERELIEKLKWPKATWTKGKRLMLNAESMQALRPILSDLNSLRLIGGEPFAAPALMDLFAIWRELRPGKALSITTNATLINDRHIEAMRGLSGLELSISVDGLGDTFTWIRGVPWHKVEAQLFKLKAAGIDFKITPTIQLVNVFNILKLYRWCRDNDIRILMNHFLIDPDFLAVRVLPEQDLIALREEAVKTLPPEDLKYFLSYLDKNSSAHDRFATQASQWIAEFNQRHKLKLSDIDSRYSAFSTAPEEELHHFRQNAKLGVPQTLTTSLPAPEEVNRLVAHLFHRLVPDGLREVNGGTVVESKSLPWGDDSTNIEEFKTRGPRLGYDRQVYYADLNDRTRYTQKEKIYLHPWSFQNSGFWDEDEDLKGIRELFFATVQVADQVSERLQPMPSAQGHQDQLMLIRYSTSPEVPQEKATLAALGSEMFGMNHDDETFFSLHLGETARELACWNYPLARWQLADTKAGQTSLLLGDYARKCGWIPNTHRLLAADWGEDSVRLSTLFERAPQDRQPWITGIGEHREELPRLFTLRGFELSKLAVLLRAEIPSPELQAWATQRGLSSEQIFLSARMEKPFTTLAELGFEKVLVLDPDSILPSTKYLDRLLCNALLYPEKYVLRLKFHERDKYFMVNLPVDHGDCIDKVVAQHGWGPINFELPSVFDGDVKIEEWRNQE